MLGAEELPGEKARRHQQEDRHRLGDILVGQGYGKTEMRGQTVKGKKVHNPVPAWLRLC